MRLSLTCSLLPFAICLVFEGRHLFNRRSGGFADISCGAYEGKKVALKCLRVYQITEEPGRTRLKRVRSSDTFMWRS